MMRVSFDAVKGGKLKEMWVVRHTTRGLPSGIVPPGRPLTRSSFLTNAAQDANEDEWLAGVQTKPPMFSAAMAQYDLHMSTKHGVPPSVAPSPPAAPKAGDAAAPKGAQPGTPAAAPERTLVVYQQQLRSGECSPLGFVKISMGKSLAALHVEIQRKGLASPLAHGFQFLMPSGAVLLPIWKPQHKSLTINDLLQEAPDTVEATPCPHPTPHCAHPRCMPVPPARHMCLPAHPAHGLHSPPRSAHPAPPALPARGVPPTPLPHASTPAPRLSSERRVPRAGR